VDASGHVTYQQTPCPAAHRGGPLELFLENGSGRDAPDVEARWKALADQHDVAVGMPIVVGHTGVRVLPVERSREVGMFGFMSSTVSSEKPKSVSVKGVVDAIRVAGRHLHRRHAAERQPDDVRPLDLELVQQRHQVIGEIVNSVGAQRNRRLAVPAGVVTDHSEPLFEIGQLRIPHPVRRAE